MLRAILLTLVSVLFTSNSFAQTNEKKLVASDSTIFDLFGVSVSIDDDYAIVGASEGFLTSSGIFSIEPGNAYVFRHLNSVWTEHTILSASDGIKDDLFGISVSIDGEYAVIGAPIHNQAKGAAYIFKRNGGVWSEQAKLLAADGNSGDAFGWSVSISGDYVCIGAHLDNKNETDSGSIYIFKRVASSTWEQQAKLTPSNEINGGQFGYSVSIDENRVLVGGFLDAYIFERINSDWTEIASLLPDGNLGLGFGTSVSISGDYAIIGNFSDDDTAINSGSAYIFRLDGKNWIQQIKLKASDATFVDWFGFSVSISNDLAIIGAPADRNNSSSAGRAYIFRRDGENWIEQTKLVASDGKPRDQFGNAVSINNGQAIVGAFADGGFQGSAYVFDDFIVGIEEPDNYFVPSGFALHQNHPNPFNPSTKISFALPSAQKVTLKVFDLNGKEVATLLQNEQKAAGIHELTFDARNLPSGVYLYKLQAGQYAETKKMILLR